MFDLHADFVGFRIWYGDGRVLTNLNGAWDQLPATDVQFVTFYEHRTYPIWLEDHIAIENYVVQFHSADYYWLDDDGRPGAGNADEAPTDPWPGQVKTGAWMLEETGVAFWTLAAEAQTVRVAP